MTILIATFSPYLSTITFFKGKYTAESVPFIIYGACLLFSGLLTLLMPDTLNMKLAETNQTMQETVTFEKATGDSTELHVNKNGEHLLIGTV